MIENQQRELIRVSPSVDDLDAARQLQVICSMVPSIEALEIGKLMSLDAKLQKGLVIVTGRFSQADLAKLLGEFVTRTDAKHEIGIPHYERLPC